LQYVETLQIVTDRQEEKKVFIKTNGATTFSTTTLSIKEVLAILRINGNSV
jgi:hypothetical protein